MSPIPGLYLRMVVQTRESGEPGARHAIPLELDEIVDFNSP